MYNKLIDKYYEDGPLKTILLQHSKAVAEKAIAIAEANPQISINREFVYEAAMLHDIGIIRCDAPGIECFGTEHSIRHGIIGAQMLRQDASSFGMTEEQIEPYARVCERHTGAGLTAKEIREQGLPLPEVDLLPETTEEKLVCYADKFFSKTRPTQEKPLERVMKSMEKFGADTVARFQELHNIFE